MAFDQKLGLAGHLIDVHRQGLDLGRIELIGTVAAFRVTTGEVVYDDVTLKSRHTSLVERIEILIALQYDGTPNRYYCDKPSSNQTSRRPL